MKVEKDPNYNPNTGMFNVTPRMTYPWEECTEIGLSFVVKGKTTIQLASAAANSKMTQIRGWKFSCRKLEDGSVRVTRVK